ncbi:MAG: hypothetical protein C4346_16375 [Chloroflexota bacterium]
MSGRAPAPRRPDNDRSSEQPASSGVWLLIWTIYGAKLATLVLVLWAAHDGQAFTLVIATTWPWLVLAAALGAGPLLFHIRLRRVRARREQLRQAEWSLTKAAGRSGAQPTAERRLPRTRRP